MAEQEWFDLYKPIKNKIDSNASVNGHMFETYGDELNYVISQDLNKIWTYSDDDNGTPYISNGYHLVNRIGYFITEVPVKEEEVIIVDMEKEEERWKLKM